MRLAIAGWLITALAVLGGYRLGLRRREARLERALAEQRERPRTRAGTGPEVALSTAAPAELPSDSLPGDSVPRSLR